VISAFIIYIHPQLQVDPNEESADLLRVLLYKTDSTTFGGDVPVVSRWTGPQRTVVAALMLLYLSFACSITAVLYAILAKQLLDLYASIDTSGSNGEKNRNRELKLKWFAMAIHILVFFLSLLVQFSLFFLTSAITVYIWNINRPVASLILYFTIAATPIYFMLGLASLVNFGFLDLPFIQRAWDWVILRFADSSPGHVNP
jgi:hypothetical protein